MTDTTTEPAPQPDPIAESFQRPHTGSGGAGADLKVAVQDLHRVLVEQNGILKEQNALMKGDAKDKGARPLPGNPPPAPRGRIGG